VEDEDVNDVDGDRECVRTRAVKTERVVEKKKKKKKKKKRERERDD
jgi:hypothetical protein